jgi:hypothetical protein
MKLENIENNWKIKLNSCRNKSKLRKNKIFKYRNKTNIKNYNFKNKWK